MGRIQSLFVAFAIGLGAFSQPLAAQAVQPAATAPATAPAAGSVNDGYQIGPEDVVEVDVLGQGDFTAVLR